MKRNLAVTFGALVLAMAGVALASPKNEIPKDKFPHLHSAIWNLDEAHRFLTDAEPNFKSEEHKKLGKEALEKIHAAREQVMDAFRFAEKQDNKPTGKEEEAKVEPLKHSVDAAKHPNSAKAVEFLVKADDELQKAIAWHRSHGSLGEHGTKARALTKEALELIERIVK
jgi:hypothetical protein